MNNWLLARGRAAETALADVAQAGARTLAIPGAATLFVPPQPLFISEADGSETQWLGRVTQATATTLSFSRPVVTSKNSGARIWRPVSALEFPPDAIIADRRALATGVTTERASGGGFFAIQVAQPLATVRLRFEDLAATAEDALIVWLAGQTQWGLSPFTLVTPEGALTALRFASEPLLQERDAAGRRRLTLTLLAQQEGTYV